MINNNFYVYLHRRKDTQEVFYIGSGSRRRAFVTSGRNAAWKAIAAESGGFEAEVVQGGLYQEESIKVEEMLTVEFRGLGYSLANIYAGRLKPESSKQKVSLALTGKVKTAAHRRNLSAANLGKKQPAHVIEKRRLSQTGLKRSDETRRRISEARRGYVMPESTKEKLRAANIGKPNAFAGKHHSEETKKLLSELKSQPILCVETGQVFSSMSAAAESIGVACASISYALARSGKCRGLTFTKIGAR